MGVKHHIEEFNATRAPSPAYSYPLYLLIFSPIILPILSGGESGGEGIVRQIAYLGVFILTLALLRIDRDLARLYALPVSAILLIGYCLLTTTWAFDPTTSLKRLGLTILIILNIWLLVSSSGYRNTVHVVTRSLIIMLFMSYLAAILVPSFGVHQDNTFESADLIGNWKGIFTHKNITGAALSLLLILLIFNNHFRHRYLDYIVIILCAVFIYKTSSKTSMGVVAISIPIGFAYYIFNQKYRIFYSLIFTSFVCLCTFLIWYNWGFIASFFDSDDALTGRVQIWPALVSFWNDHFWGAGFGSFWNIQNGNPIESYVKSKSYVLTIFSGHNGYLDLLVTIGLPGVVLTAVILIFLPLASVLWHGDIPTRRGATIFALIVFCALQNLTETSIMDRDQLVHMFLMTAIALIPVARSRIVRRQSSRTDHGEYLESYGVRAATRSTMNPT